MTALQELKLKTEEFLEINKENFNELPNSEVKEITELLIKTIFDKMLYSIDVLLEKEKQQIVDAFETGDNNFSLYRQFDDGIGYFNQTYIQKS